MSCTLRLPQYDGAKLLQFTSNNILQRLSKEINLLHQFEMEEFGDFPYHSLSEQISIGRSTTNLWQLPYTARMCFGACSAYNTCGQKTRLLFIAADDSSNPPAPLAATAAEAHAGRSLSPNIRRPPSLRPSVTKPINPRCCVEAIHITGQQMGLIPLEIDYEVEERDMFFSFGKH